MKDARSIDADTGRTGVADRGYGFSTLEDGRERDHLDRDSTFVTALPFNVSSR